MESVFELSNVFEARNIDENDIKNEQSNDKNLKSLMNHLTNGTTPSFKEEGLQDYRMVYKQLCVEDGILKKKSPNGKVVVVPENKVREVMYHVHDGPAAAHYGISKSYYKLVARYYFPKLATRLSDYISTCEGCLKRKMPKREPRPELQPIDIDYLSIGSVVSYDFKGPLPLASKTTLYQSPNRYILVIIEHASRYVIAYPTPTMEARCVSEIMLGSWIPRFGVPSVIISDRAKTFSGYVLRSIYKALQIEVRLTAAYNPMANGMCEQVNRNISSLLRVMLDDNVEDWPNKLNTLFSAYNASPQTSTGYSPNFIIYGRELIEPLDILLQTSGIRGVKENRVVDELQNRLHLRRKALEHLQTKFEEVNEKVRLKTRISADAPTYQVGERVGFRPPIQGNKIKKSYELHHVVIKVHTPTTYVIKNMHNGFVVLLVVMPLQTGGSNGISSASHMPSSGGRKSDISTEGADCGALCRCPWLWKYAPFLESSLKVTFLWVPCCAWGAWGGLPLS